MASTALNTVEPGLASRCQRCPRHELPVLAIPAHAQQPKVNTALWGRNTSIKAANAIESGVDVGYRAGGLNICLAVATAVRLHLDRSFPDQSEKISSPIKE